MQPSRTLLPFRCLQANDDFFQHGADGRREIEPAAVLGDQDRPVAPLRSGCGFDCSNRGPERSTQRCGQSAQPCRSPISVDLIFIMILESGRLRL